MSLVDAAAKPVEPFYLQYAAADDRRYAPIGAVSTPFGTFQIALGAFYIVFGLVSFFADPQPGTATPHAVIPLFWLVAGVCFIVGGSLQMRSAVTVTIRQAGVTFADEITGQLNGKRMRAILWRDIRSVQRNGDVVQIALRAVRPSLLLPIAALGSQAEPLWTVLCDRLTARGGLSAMPYKEQYIVNTAYPARLIG